MKVLIPVFHEHHCLQSNMAKCYFLILLEHFCEHQEMLKPVYPKNLMKIYKKLNSAALFDRLQFLLSKVITSSLLKTQNKFERTFDLNVRHHLSLHLLQAAIYFKVEPSLVPGSFGYGIIWVPIHGMEIQFAQYQSSRRQCR